MAASVGRGSGFVDVDLNGWYDNGSGEEEEEEGESRRV